MEESEALNEETDHLSMSMNEKEHSAPSSSSSSSSSTDSDPSTYYSSLSKESKDRIPNILEDSIEPLRPEQVRWFYKEDGQKTWTPFIGYDSLRIECKYREVQSRKIPLDEQEEAVCVLGGLYEADVVNSNCLPIYWGSSENTSEIMRGTWFFDGSWQPLEEHADQLESEHTGKFQKNGTDQASDESAASVGQPKKNSVLHRVKFKDYYIDWLAADQVWLHYVSKSSKIGRAIGLSKGSRLQRGYWQEATMDDRPPDISHLIFVIHGIGQKMDTRSITKNCNLLRETCQKVMQRCFPQLEASEIRAEFIPVEWRSSLKLDGDIVESITPNKVRGLRSILNATAMDIMYYTSPLYRSEIINGLQTELNSLHELFCNRNPYFEAKKSKISVIAHSLGCVILYDIVTGWNPVLLYDQYVNSIIAKQQTADDSTDTKKLLDDLQQARNRVVILENKLVAKASEQSIKKPNLNFKIENFFCLGSPLPVFLMLRGMRPKGDGSQDHILPRTLCSRLFNIYHPSDPVAYRLEPLMLRSYATICPLKIHRYDASKKTPYDEMKPEAFAAAMVTENSSEDTDESFEDLVYMQSNSSNKSKEEDTSISGRLGGMFSGWRSKAPAASPAQDQMIAELKEVKTDKTDKTPPASPVKEDASPIEDTELEYRVDYQLKEGKMESAYLSAITSHMAYWSSLDVALFILTQVFPDHTPR